MKFLTTLIFVLTASTAFALVDLREELQKVAQASDPNYPNGTEVQLTHFSSVCSLGFEQKRLHIVDQRAVVLGMLAPRGNNQISFFSDDLKFVGSLRYIGSRPLWCEGSKLYLFGGWDGALPGDQRCSTGGDCNVIEWDAKAETIKLYHEKKYGSSGGIEDP